MLKFIPVRGRKLTHMQEDEVEKLLKFIPVRGRKPTADIRTNGANG